MNTEITFGDWLKRRRRALDLTQKELAEQIGYSVGTIRKIEANERRPSKQMAQLLADHLEVAPEQKEIFVIFARSEPDIGDREIQLPGLGNDLIGKPPLPHIPGASLNSTVASNLPQQTTSFVGRETELAALDALLRDPAVRLVSIIGPGGIGKTRLAIEIATRQHANYAHGVHFVSLAPLDSADQLVQPLMESLKLSFSSGDGLRAQLLRYLRTRQLLLLMDNVEHLAAGGQLLNEILAAAPGITILVTSREKLNLSSETVFGVSGLEYDDWQTPEEALAHGAAQLFLQSARRARPQYALRPDDVQPVARICRMVEGMPLGILLAAAWIDLLSPQEIAAEINHSLDFLATKLHDMPSRQRSLRAVFSTSWDRLSAAERKLFKTLTVFRGGFTREAASKVAGASLAELAALNSKSFLRRDHESGRHEIHELLRQYGQERLMAIPEAVLSAQEAHARYFAQFMDEMSRNLRSARQKAFLDLIERDIDNVRASWRFLAQSGDSKTLAKLVDSLWYFHEIRGWYHAGVELFDSAETSLLAYSNDDDSRALAAQMLGAKAWFVSLLGQVQHAKELAQRSITSLRALDRSQELLIPFSGLAMSDYYLHKIPEVIEASRESLNIAKEFEQEWWEAAFLSWIAVAHAADQSSDEAWHYAIAAEKKVKNTGDPWLSYFPNLTLAQLASLEGIYVTAKARFQFSLEAANSVNFKRGMAYANNFLGDVSTLLEEFVEAEGYYQQSLRIGHEIGQTRELLADLTDIARVRAALGRASEAIELLVVVLQNPANTQTSGYGSTTIYDNAEKLRAEVETMLPPDEYAAAWQRGKALDFEVTVANLMDQDKNRIL
jgi:predicted ATPase/transcriptional regulator with XRE-family HTH domain